MNLYPDEKIRKLIERRDDLRRKGKYVESDAIRKQLEELGYNIHDSVHESVVHRQPIIKDYTKSRYIALFGSGELSPTGRGIHEYLIKSIIPPLSIALLETPAGYEDNPHQWYEKLERMMETGLQNYKPVIHKIPALRNNGLFSTNSSNILLPLQNADYIHTGAGSPTYAVKHLKKSLTMESIIHHIDSGKPISFASAAVCAISKHQLPVYELYYVGDDPFWNDGLNIFSKWKYDLTFIPHWNNAEGGATIDTRFCYMGQKRFDKLRKLLPDNTSVMGIDEQTAAIFNTENKAWHVHGVGSVHILKHNQQTEYVSGSSFKLDP